MTVREIMERSGIKETGRAIAYIKDALDDMALEGHTHTETVRMDIVKGKRFYHLPNNAIKILDIRAKDHDNNEGHYRSIPRLAYEPAVEDSDGI